MPAPIVYQKDQGLVQGILGASSAISSGIEKYYEKQRFEKEKQERKAETQKYGNILSDVLNSLPEDASPIQISGALSLAVNQGVPLEYIDSFSNVIKNTKQAKQGLQPGPQEIEEVANLFGKFGMGAEEASRNAELWGMLTTGGQTEFAKILVDKIARSGFDSNQETPSLGFAPLKEESVVSKPEVESFKFPKVNIFEDRTPKERTSLKTELLKSNNKELEGINDSLKKTDTEIMRYDQLERLNDSGKLPESLGRLNINWTTGDIKFPALANPETQLFVKTINDFTTAAKDTYGARVTNFELGAFMKRLPTLANTTEGRRLILSQMKAMKDLDRLYDESIKSVYDHYGVQKIDKSNVEKIAKELRKDDEEKIRKDFANSIKAQEVFEARQLAPEGKIPAISPEGKVVYIWRDKADIAEKQGYRIQ